MAGAGLVEVLVGQAPECRDGLTAQEGARGVIMPEVDDLRFAA